MKHTTGLDPRLHVDTSGSAAVGQAGGVLLVETIRTSGIGRGLSAALQPWRKPLAVHDPAKIVLDLAMALALGGDCLADVDAVRAESAGGTHAFLGWLTSRRLSYSVEFTLGATSDVLEQIPADVWTPAYTSDGGIRDGAWVAELTGLLDLR